MSAFPIRLIEAMKQARQSQEKQSWTRALLDLNELALEFNLRIETDTQKRVGTGLIPMPKEQLKHKVQDTHKIYTFTLFGEERTKVITHLGLFAVPASGHYPMLVLNDLFQVAGMLPDREALEEQFLAYLRFADVKFLSTLFEKPKITPTGA